MSRNLTPAETAARLEDVRWMAETGECLDGAARRLGMTRKALEKWLTRADREALRVLVAHQPKDHNRFAAAGVSICELTGLGRKRARNRANRAQREAAA